MDIFRARLLVHSRFVCFFASIYSLPNDIINLLHDPRRSVTCVP